MVGWLVSGYAKGGPVVLVPWEEDRAAGSSSPQDVDRLACLGEDEGFGLGVAVGAGLVPDGGGAEGLGGQSGCAGGSWAPQCCVQAAGGWPGRCHDGH